MVDPLLLAVYMHESGHVDIAIGPRGGEDVSRFQIEVLGVEVERLLEVGDQSVRVSRHSSFLEGTHRPKWPSLWTWQGSWLNLSCQHPYRDEEETYRRYSPLRGLSSG